MFKKDGWILKDQEGNDVTIGDDFKTFRGEPCTLKGGSPPHKPGSTGRVYVQIGEGGREFFPGVINLRWVPA
jgi:hypothetical protein